MKKYIVISRKNLNGSDGLIETVQRLLDSDSEAELIGGLSINPIDHLKSDGFLGQHKFNQALLVNK